MSRALNAKFVIHVFWSKDKKKKNGEWVKYYDFFVEQQIPTYDGYTNRSIVESKEGIPSLEECVAKAREYVNKQLDEILEYGIQHRL